MGKRGRSRRSPSPQTRFTRSKTRQMENLLEKKDVELDFVQKLTEELNVASRRTGSRTIQMEEVHQWFQRKKKHQANDITSSSSPPKELHNISETGLSNSAHKSSSDLAKDTGENVSDEMDLEFEARSSKDGAWYDVATFIAHRVCSSGGLEVHVRYQGYGAEDDEWVNVKKAVRQRSIPLESLECHKYAVGDLVLCFRETSEQAAYYDAHVMEIHRKMHDIRGCRCLFLIRYDHDKTEERVYLGSLCWRPSD